MKKKKKKERAARATRGLAGGPCMRHQPGVFCYRCLIILVSPFFLRADSQTARAGVLVDTVLTGLVVCRLAMRADGLRPALPVCFFEGTYLRRIVRHADSEGEAGSNRRWIFCECQFTFQRTAFRPYIFNNYTMFSRVSLAISSSRGQSRAAAVATCLSDDFRLNPTSVLLLPHR